MDILAIRDLVRKEEKVVAPIVNDDGMLLGELTIEDMLCQLAGGVDVIDFHGEFKVNRECTKSADCTGIAIDLGDIKLSGGMVIIKQDKGWRECRRLYEVDGSRTGGFYFHAETQDLRDLEIDKMPDGNDLDEDIKIFGADGKEVGTLGDVTFDTPEASVATIEAD